MRRLTVLLLLILAAPAQATIVADPPVTVASGIVGPPRLALERAGGAVAAWSTEDGVFVRRQAPDGTWAAPQRLGDRPQYGVVRLVKDRDGARGVLWRDSGEQGDVELSVVADDGSFGASETVPVPEGGSVSGDLATVDADGSLILTGWRPGNSGSEDLVALRRRPDGSWAEPELMIPEAVYWVTPADLTGAGGRLVALLSIGGDRKRLATVERRGDGTWTAPAPFGNAVHEDRSLGTVYTPRLATDDAGTMAAALPVDDPAYPSSFAQIQGAVRSSGAAGWATSLLANIGFSPTVVMSPGGTLVTAWFRGIASMQLRFTDGRTEEAFGRVQPERLDAPTVAVDDAGHLVLLDRTGGGAGLYARDPGGCFQSIATLAAPGTYDVGDADLALRAGGSGLVLWGSGRQPGELRAAILRNTPSPAPACPPGTPTTFHDAAVAAGIPDLTITEVPKVVGRRALLRRGLRVHVRTRTTTHLRLSVRTAKRKRLVGRTSVTRKAGRHVVRVKLRKRRLRSAHRLRLTVRATAHGRTTVRTRVVRVRR